MSQTPLPDFLIVGAAKSGTSSLHYYLNQHPDIFMPSYTKEGIKVKEPMFLVKDEVKGRVHRGIWSFEDYKSLFEGGKSAKAIGEATVFYLNFYEEAIPNIKKYLGNDVKIIILLRDPVERAYSAYHHTLRNNVQENLSFEEALKIEEKRYKGNRNITPMTLYKTMGEYYNMVKAYKDNFSKVMVILNDDLIKNTAHVVQDVFRFLDVDPNVNINYSEKKNVGGWNWKSKKIKHLYLNQGPVKRVVKGLINALPFVKKRLQKKLIDSNKEIIPEIKPSTKAFLNDYYKADVEKLSQLIGRDLSGWLK